MSEPFKLAEPVQAVRLPAAADPAQAATECLAHDLRTINAPISVSAVVPAAVDTRIAASSRNRPAAFAAARSEDAQFVEQALTDLTTTVGAPPEEVAGIIVDAIRHVQIHIGGRLVRRVVVFLVNGNRKYRGIVAKNRGSPVSMMHIGINHQGVANRSVGLQTPDRHRHIVNRAKTFAMIGISVMKSAAEVSPEAVA